MKKFHLTCLLFIAMLCTACSSEIHNEAGQRVIDLPAGKKLLCSGQSQAHYTFTYRDMHDGEKPETYTMMVTGDTGTWCITIREH